MPRFVGIKIAEETPESLALTRMLDYYGHYCKPGKARKDRKLSQYSVPILAEIPLRIKDERKMTTRLCWLSLGEVGLIFVAGDPLRVVKAPAISSVTKATTEKYGDIARTVEGDMVLSAPSEFAQLTYESFFLQSLTVSVAKLEESLDEGIAISLDDRHLKSFYHIVESGYASAQKQDEEVVFEANEKFKVARKELPDSAEFCRRLTGMVLGIRYEQITADLPALKANVRGSLAYYEPAVEYGEPIAMTEDNICEVFKRRYKPSKAKLDTFRFVTLPGLERVGILCRDKDKIAGDSKVYENFYNLANEKIPVIHRIEMEPGNVIGL